ncbi:unnamed protein product [Arctogadus glacialis]
MSLPCDYIRTERRVAARGWLNRPPEPPPDPGLEVCYPPPSSPPDPGLEVCYTPPSPQPDPGLIGLLHAAQPSYRTLML